MAMMQIPSRQISVADAKNQLPALLHEAETGSPVEITRRGKAVAVIVSITEFRRLQAGKPDLVAALRAWRERAQISDAEVDTLFAGLRDPSPGRDVTW